MSEDIDFDRIKNKLDELEGYLRDLEEDLPQNVKEYTKNRVIKRACEKDFELISQFLIDVCNLIISQEGLGYPEDNREAIGKLVENEILKKELGDSLKDMISFRNLIVHRYGNIDDSKAYQHLKEGKNDFFEFINSINSFFSDL